jgi:hypothetical protein
MLGLIALCDPLFEFKCSDLLLCQINLFKNSKTCTSLPTNLVIRLGGVKAHYGGQKLLSHISFFEIMQHSTSTKPILEKVFINYAKKKAIQMPNNAIIKGTKILINIK